MSEIARMGEVYVFTASTQKYADPIIDEIDPKGFIKGRFYREVRIYQE
jgi:TFIIF-interacting CTD phosphatase-like protein